MKCKKLLSALSLAFAVSMAMTACGSSTESTVSEATTATQVQETTTSAEASDSLVFGTLNLSYADFYYGELNHIEPEVDATKGQYDVENKVTAAGYLEEGMYDAVTSATKQKSTRFATTYFEEEGEGVNILGVSNVNVAISEALYQDVQNAINNGTTCNNELFTLVQNMTVVNETPVEYKVINSDGTLSRTIGETTVRSDLQASFTSISSWGNYQFNFEGLELEADQVIGAYMETEDGAKYGLEHEDNLWLHPSEVSFCVVPFKEPHGNEVAYQRFADMQGKTITKFTYMIANGADIEIPVNAFVYEQLGDGFEAKADTDVTYSTEGTKIHYELTIPEDSSYELTAVKCGRSVLDLAQVSIADNTITLPDSFGPGNYSFIFEDKKYAGLSVSTLVDSGLSDGDVIVKDDTLEINIDCGLTPSQYLANFSSITVNGEPVMGKGLGKLVFDENGTICKDAAIENEGTSTPIFADGENKVEISATGFPNVTFTLHK